MTTLNRNLTRGLLPALLLSAALAVPAASVAAPSPKDKAHAAEKAKRQKHQAQKQARQARQHAQKAQKQAVRAQKSARQAQRQAVRTRAVAPKRTVVRERVVVPQRRVVERVAVPERRVVQRVVVPQRRVVTQPVPVARNRRAWDGWNRRYSRYSTGTFRLAGTFIGQQHGCALVQDRSGQVIPLLGNPGNLRRGDFLEMSGRMQNSSVCGTAFRVLNVDRINGDDFFGYNDRYNDRYRNNDRYRDPYYDDRDNRDHRDLVSIVGRLDDSGRCPVIRGDRGEYYDLVGDLRNFRHGDHARVIGFLGVRSSCGGQAIDVQEID
jgi:hypothetical protein